MIGRKLFLDKRRPGRVVIETRDDVITVSPSIRAKDIVFAAMGICKMNRVEPMASPSLSITWRVKKLIDEFAIGIRIFI